MGFEVFGALTCVYAVVCLQLMFKTELFATAVAFVGFLSSVDTLVALQRALIPEAATTELTLIWVVTYFTEKSYTLTLHNKAVKMVSFTQNIKFNSNLNRLLVEQ